MEKKITKETVQAMQADYDGGMTLREISKKYGVYTKAVSRCVVHKPHHVTPRKEGVPIGFITLDEVRKKRDSLREGDKVEIPLVQYDDDLNQIGRRLEECTVKHVSNRVVRLQRRNGMTVDHTTVELCMLDRGVMI